MLPTYNAVIADTSCFILLDKLGALQLLHDVFGQLTTTSTIAKEYGKPLPVWINIIDSSTEQSKRFLHFDLDAGEATAIALALEDSNTLLVMDDLKGRKVARLLNITLTGSIGVIVKAKQRGIISSIKPLLDELQKTDFRASDKVIDEAYKIAGENRNLK
jgi:predicted nucleic acid-binding protein